MIKMSEVIKELEMCGDYDGLKKLLTAVQDTYLDAVYAAVCVIEQYTKEEFDQAWIYPERFEELTKAIALVYCGDDEYDHTVARLQRALDNVSFSKLVTLEDAELVWSEDKLADLPDDFETFIEQCGVCYSSEACIPVDELYERFVYLKNKQHNRIYWYNELNEEF